MDARHKWVLLRSVSVSTLIFAVASLFSAEHVLFGSDKLPVIPRADANRNEISASNKIPSLSARKLMSRNQHIKWLERNGELPKDFDKDELVLAWKTSWWGKPLDHKEFWKGKTIWRDGEALNKAFRHGRMYPPIPFEDSKLVKRSKSDFSEPGGPDSPELKLHQNDKENAFWERFDMSHPRPPEEIQTEQLQIASMLSSISDTNEQPSRPFDGDRLSMDRAIQANYPPEAVNRTALFWTYVLSQRDEYTKYSEPGDPGNGLRQENLLRRLRVNPSYVQNPLSDEQLRAANEWKIAYLNRLKQQNTDPSYINAYLKAWKLPTNVLSAGSQK